MATSEKRMKQSIMAEWINLNADQVMAIDNAIDEALDTVDGLPDYERGRAHFLADFLRNVQARTVRSRNISTRQLAGVQKGILTITHQDLYIKGLEGYLIQGRRNIEIRAKQKLKQIV